MVQLPRNSLAIAFVAGWAVATGVACGSAGPAETPAVASEAGSAAAAADSGEANFTCRGRGATAPEPEAAREKAEGAPTQGVTDIVGGVYGDPEAATRYWAEQSEGDCGLMATRMVIGEITGTPPTEREIIDLAADTPSECAPGEPVYDESYDPSDGGIGHGTCSRDLPLLLRHFGIEADYTNDDEAADGGLDTGLDALADYLGNGQQAMVCVNSRIIWDTDGDRTNCGHMITVAAIDFDNDIVYLGDSGGEDTRGEQVNIDTFESAWATGDHELVVTR